VVGPGLKSNGQDNLTWADHTDVRPTMLSLVGLKDTYVHDGRVLTEAVDENVQPVRLRGHTETLRELARVFKQINAPFGQLAANALKISTFALASGDPSNDAIYTTLSNKLLGWTAQRNAIAHEMRAMLDGAAFNDEVFDEVRGRELVAEAQTLLDEVAQCAGNAAGCAH
jgi:hypothetical protein